MREGWTYKKLGEVCEILNGFAFKSGNYTEQGIRVLRITNVQKGLIVDDDPKYYPFDEETNLKQYMLKEGDLLMSLTGNVGRVGLLQKNLLPAALNQRVACLRIKNSNIQLEYIFHLLNSDCFERDCIFNATGIAQKNMSTEWLKKYNIPIPSLSEQQSIVAELDKINELISLKKAQLSDLDSLAQSIFYDMFGDPIENEKGWEVKKLGEVVDITAKLVDPNQEPYCNQFHVGPANIIGGTGEIVDCLIAKDENLISGKYAFKSGDVLYSKIRPNLNKVAIPSFEGVCSADMYPLSIKTNAVNLYIMRLLMTNEFLKYAVNCSGRARMPKINREALFEFKFCLPPLSLQQEFAKRIELIEQQKAQISSTIKDLETLLASRMQYWFD